MSDSYLALEIASYIDIYGIGSYIVVELVSSEYHILFMVTASGATSLGNSTFIMTTEDPIC